eukprot:NODE_28729_length_468_cov_1.263930.p3 GENE.NODE_28729_length_468_cov_1.263930~~NODE_28729_length_468_cov_1.263930.p3  ORF type:complete len:59 (+),score=3.25 NODE_28729_length_468_cov_1.263930:264-440(+)
MHALTHAHTHECGQQACAERGGASAGISVDLEWFESPRCRRRGRLSPLTLQRRHLRVR